MEFQTRCFLSCGKRERYFSCSCTGKYLTLNPLFLCSALQKRAVSGGVFLSPTTTNSTSCPYFFASLAYASSSFGTYMVVVTMQTSGFVFIWRTAGRYRQGARALRRASVAFLLR